MAVCLAVVAAVAGLAWLVHFLAGDIGDDQALRFDPLPPRPPSLWYLDFFQRWRRRPQQLTYRRDRRGRYRKHRR